MIKNSLQFCIFYESAANSSSCIEIEKSFSRPYGICIYKKDYRKNVDRLKSFEESGNVDSFVGGNKKDILAT